MQSTIERQVMASVGVIYTARAVLSPLALKLYAALGASVALWQLTWVHRVFENWANVGLSGSAQFVAHAVAHTHLSVQVTLLVLAAAGLALAWDFVRPLARPQVRFA